MFGIVDKFLLDNILKRGSKDNKNNIIPSNQIHYQEETLGKLIMKIKERNKSNVRTTMNSKPSDIKLKDLFPNKCIIKCDATNNEYYVKIIQIINHEDEDLEKYYLLE